MRDFVSINEMKKQSTSIPSLYMHAHPHTRVLTHMHACACENGKSKKTKEEKEEEKGEGEGETLLDITRVRFNEIYSLSMVQ